MDSARSVWWARHGWTVALLLVAFGAALAVRTIWAYPVVAQWGPLYTYGGGSDSYYHSRVMTYIIQTHHNLIQDPLLKFPIGSINPREPLFDWMNGILGTVFAPFFDGNAVVAGSWFLDLDAPLWAALCVFPIYLIGREVSGRRAGLMAALIYPFLSASINSTTFGYANYLPFYTFFLLVVVYSFLRTVKAVGHRRWIERYGDPKQYLPGLKGFLTTERTAVKWSVFTGVALGAFALSWQGYTYGVVVIGFTVLVAMLIERIRRVDSFGLYVSTWIIGLVAFPMAAPYYLVQHEIRIFLLLPILLFFGTLLLLLPFLLMRDVPWVVSIPSLVVFVGAAVLGLATLEPKFFSTIVTGQGYFVKNLIYSTVAEAQPPSIDDLIVGYGVVTFFLAFVGLALAGYLLVQHRFKRHHIAFLVFAVVSVYLPISATKFFEVGTPAFALLSAEAIHRLLDIGGYPELRRSVASLADRGSRLMAFRKSFKARHALVLALVVGLLLPNIWISVDAGIPSNTKDQAAAQINQTIPSWLKLNSSTPSSSYLGAAGSGLDTPNQYDSAAYNWLAQQDANTPEPQRPAFISWWDYGFQAIDQGGHPSVADNFQNGIDPAGQFLLSQNESLAVAILATTLLQGEIQLTHNPTLPDALNAILAADGVNVTTLHQLLSDEAADYATVIKNPGTYLPVNPKTITYDNAMYLATSYYLASHLSLAKVAKVYDDLQLYTGWSIRYAMTDSRLFPFSGTSTGIFYAPADLTGRVISNQGVPTTFYNVSILGSDGQRYPLGPLPPGVRALRYDINWSSPFYRTMLYRTYIGYNGTDVGQSGGIPGLSGAAASDPIRPGWMLQHFEVLYQTAYVCPGVRNAQAGAGCFYATNYPDAKTIANRTNGTAILTANRYFQGGESILAYYPGQTLLGTVALPDGTPVAGVRVTVDDGRGVPHMTVVTATNGSFSLVLPPGQDTLRITTGAFDAMNQTDKQVLRTVALPVSDAIGFSPSAPALVRTFTIQNATVHGLLYWNVANNTTFDPHVDPVVPGATVVLTGPGGPSLPGYVTDPSGTFQANDVAPGVYNVSVTVAGRPYNTTTLNVSSGGTVTATFPLAPGSVTGTVTNANGKPYAGATVELVNANGVLASGVSSKTGTYTLEPVPPGNFTVVAVGTDPALRSQGVAVSLTSAGATASANLTLARRGLVAVAVAWDGAFRSNVPVRFVPDVPFGNGSVSAVQAAVVATTNTVLATTNASGIARAALPLGTYTIEALGSIGGRSMTALGRVVVTAPGTVGAPIVLTLQPAVAVTVALTGSTVNGSRTAVAVYGANGTEVVGWATTNNSAFLQLPPGSYSFLGFRGTTTAGSPPVTAFVRANVTLPTTVHLALGATVTSSFQVGAVGPTGGFLGAVNATVVVSTDPSGPQLQEISDAAGRVGFYLPTTPSGASGGYCLSASAFGFARATSCGLAPGDLANLSRFPLRLLPVNVTLNVVGLPSGTSVTVNLTGESATSVNRSYSGGPTFAFPLPPGTYGVGARAVIGNGTVVYLPSSVLSTVIPVGATYSNLTLLVVPEIQAHGTLVLAPSVPAKMVTVALTSPLLNLSVNGTTFSDGFRATPTTYSATASVKYAGVSYVSVTRLTIYPNGTVQPKLVLKVPGVTVQGTLTKPGGSTLPVNTSVAFVNGVGATTVVSATSGTFSTVLPADTYHLYANATASTAGKNGSYLESWSASPGATCSIATNRTSCAVPMVGTVLTVPVHGTLVGPYGRVAGSVRLVGPYPATNVTVLTTTNGSFSADLLPGAYYAYGASTGGSPLAGFGRVLALPLAPDRITLHLGPAWTATISVTVARNVTSSPAFVTIKGPLGNFTTFVGVPVGTSLAVPLPDGTYAIHGNATGTRNGIHGTATAASTVVLANGNVGTTLRMSVPVAATVSATVAGPASATVAAGGWATFGLAVRGSGNVPVTVHAVGSPTGWGFNFSFGAITLVPGETYSGEVRILVPNGTATNHPPVAITFELANGTAAGTLLPPPTVNVIASYGIAAGSAKSPKAIQVGANRALLPFYVRNSGNTLEVVQLAVVNAAHLASLGWSTSFLSAGKPTGASVNLPAGQNQTITVNVSTKSSTAVPPDLVVVQATVQSAPSTLTSTVYLTIPRTSVAPTGGSVSVGGPSVTGGPSPIPVWFVPLVSFVPAIALVVGLLARRWWKTRRWIRR